MITKEQFEIITDDHVRKFIDENIETDPMRLALAGGLPSGELALACGQIKYLAKAKDKFPQLWGVRAVIPSLAFEQSSSEQAAALKEFSGDLCIDLTCGLGIDTLHFAGNFKRVISVERSEELARVVTYNLALLGVDNVTLVCDSAENFLKEYAGARADLIYVDPDRRGDDGRKLVLLEHCSPNVVELLPELLRLSRRVAVKISPLFDVDELFRIFGDDAVVEVVSVGGECKELVLIVGEGVRGRTISIKSFRKGHLYSYLFDKEYVNASAKCAPEDYLKYLLVPDVAFYKARVVHQYLREVKDVYVSSQTGFCFGDSVPEDFCGTAYEIVWCEEYQPKRLKKRLRSEGISRVNVLRRDFRLSVSEIVSGLGLREGGDHFMAFTTLGSRNVAMLLRRVL